MERYDRKRELGRGAFGVAELVQEKESKGRFCVIKKIDLSRMALQDRKGALAEVDVLRRFALHSHIVELYDAFFEDSYLHIVMEFADGGDLSAAVKHHKDIEKQFVEADALTIFAQCLMALNYVHSKRILHRDIKSQNIFIFQAGVAKLGDFGIAKMVECTGELAHSTIGTPGYMAPEVCNNCPYGVKTDIWSIGVVLYEILALQQPFQATNIAALIIKILTASPPPLPEPYSQDAQKVVTLSLDKEPATRPTAEQLLNLPIVRQCVGKRFDVSGSTRPKTNASGAARRVGSARGIVAGDHHNAVTDEPIAMPLFSVPARHLAKSIESATSGTEDSNDKAAYSGTGYLLSRAAQLDKNETWEDALEELMEQTLGASARTSAGSFSDAPSDARRNSWKTRDAEELRRAELLEAHRRNRESALSNKLKVQGSRLASAPFATDLEEESPFGGRREKFRSESAEHRSSESLSNCGSSAALRGVGNSALTRAGRVVTELGGGRSSRPTSATRSPSTGSRVGTPSIASHVGGRLPPESVDFTTFAGARKGSKGSARRDSLGSESGLDTLPPSAPTKSSASSVLSRVPTTSARHSVEVAHTRHCVEPLDRIPPLPRTPEKREGLAAQDSPPAVATPSWVLKYANVPLDMSRPLFLGAKEEEVREDDIDQLLNQISQFPERPSSPKMDITKQQVTGTVEGNTDMTDTWGLSDEWKGAEAFSDSGDRTRPLRDELTANPDTTERTLDLLQEIANDGNSSLASPWPTTNE